MRREEDSQPRPRRTAPWEKSPCQRRSTTRPHPRCRRPPCAAARKGRCKKGGFSRPWSWPSSSTSPSRRRPIWTCSARPTSAAPASSATRATPATPPPSFTPPWRSTAPTPAWLGQVADELARCRRDASRRWAGRRGAGRRRAASPVYAADAALQQDAAGRASLPEALHADFDRVVLAFQQAEAGKDDDARATLQGIGLRSPFLEWKVLLRGLQAYYVQRRRPRPGELAAAGAGSSAGPPRRPVPLPASTPSSAPPSRRRRRPPCNGSSTAPRAASRCCRSCARCGRRWPTTTRWPSPSATPRRCCRPCAARRRRLVDRLASCFYWAAVDTGPDDVLALQARLRPAGRRPELLPPGGAGPRAGRQPGRGP